MWDRIYDVYVQDSYGLVTEQFFRQQNPAALQEITAVMLETARKGMWKASEQQLNTLASLHTELVEEFGSTGSGFSGGNAKFRSSSPDGSLRSMRRPTRTGWYSRKKKCPAVNKVGKTP